MEFTLSPQYVTLLQKNPQLYKQCLDAVYREIREYSQDQKLKNDIMYDQEIHALVEDLANKCVS